MLVAKHLSRSIGGCRSTYPALSDLVSGRSVRVLYAPLATFLPAALPVPSRNTLPDNAIPLSALPGVLAGQSEWRTPVRAAPAPAHGPAGYRGLRRAGARQTQRM